MKISISKESLVAGLQCVQGPTTTKQNFPILGNVLIEATNGKISLTTTDLDISIISSFPAHIHSLGKITIPHKKIFSVVRELPDTELLLETVKNNLLIKCENIEFKLNTTNVEEFPQIEPTKETSLIKINPQELLFLLKLTMFCVGTEDTNYILSGIHFELTKNTLCAAATDGKRLSCVECRLPASQPELQTKTEFTIPIKAAHEIQKILKEKKEEIFFFTEQNKIGFDLKETQLFARPIEGEFPRYSEFIPKPQKEKLTVNRREFFGALKRASLLATPEHRGVKLDVTQHAIIISKATPQQGEVKENLPCTYNGKLLQVGFNPIYLMDVLRNLETEDVHIEFAEPDNRALLRQEDYTYLVLPLKI